MFKVPYTKHFRSVGVHRIHKAARLLRSLENQLGTCAEWLIRNGQNRWVVTRLYKIETLEHIPHNRPHTFIPVVCGLTQHSQCETRYAACSINKQGKINRERI